MKYILITGIVILLVNPGYPQQDSLWIEDKHSSELEISSTDEEENYLPDYLEEITEDPVNINSAELKDLLRVPGMSNSDALEILEYRKKSGHIFSLFELYTVNNLNALRLRNYFPYMCTEDKINHIVIDKENNSHTMRTDLRSRIAKSIQTRRGYKEGIYFGNEYKIYNRLKITSDKNYNFGIVAEKDAGEQDYMDHTAFYLHVKDQGIIKSFIAGDYNIEFGKGLVVWSPYGFSKTPASFNGYRPGRNTAAYLSTDEGKYLRGSAVNAVYENIELTAYYSRREKDAALDSTGRKIRSLINNGYHRSESEISRKGKVSEIVYGTHLDFYSNHFSAGILFNSLKTNLSFTENSGYPLGNSFNNISLIYSVSFKKLILSGEASYFRGSVAHLNSLNLDITNNIKAVFILRNSPVKYTSILSPSPAGESGSYAGISITLLPGTLNLYFDSYKLSGLAHLFPVECNELFADYTINPSSRILVRTRYKRNTRHTNDAKLYSKNIRENVSAELTYRLSPSIKWKCRFDYSQYSESFANIDEYGYAFYQDAVYTLSKPVEIYGRITFFDSPNYNTRIYQYEKDIAGTFIINPLYEEGLRWYVGLNISIMEGIKLQGKYSETYKPDLKTMGSGYNELKGNLDNQFSLQMDFKI